MPGLGAGGLDSSWADPRLDSAVGRTRFRITPLREHFGDSGV
jgi:hypothetical protein